VYLSGTYSKFGAQLRFSLQKTFPLLTTKQVSRTSYFILWIVPQDIFWLGVLAWCCWGSSVVPQRLHRL
jgi:thymidylate synthase